MLTRQELQLSRKGSVDMAQSENLAALLVRIVQTSPLLRQVSSKERFSPMFSG